jgi:hypothetical protein
MQVLDSLADWGGFAVSEGGIHFRPTPEPGSPRSIRFYRFANQSVETLVELESVVNLTVSADSRFLLYTQSDLQAADLMLAENFR